MMRGCGMRRPVRRRRSCARTSARSRDATFSPDGRWILTAGPAAAHLWQPGVRDPILPYGFGGHKPVFSSAVFDPEQPLRAHGGDGWHRAQSRVRRLPGSRRVARPRAYPARRQSSATDPRGTRALRPRLVASAARRPRRRASRARRGRRIVADRHAAARGRWRRTPGRSRRTRSARRRAPAAGGGRVARSGWPRAPARARSSEPPELRVGAHAARGLELDGEPVGVRFDDRTEHRAEALVEPDVRVAARHLDRQLDEEGVLAREVVEDRAAREADLLLQPRDGRALVAVLREAAAGAIEDLLAAALLVLCGDLRHIRTLQNRTDVLYYRGHGAREQARGRSTRPRRADLDARLADDVPGAAVVRAGDDGLGGEDERRPRGADPADGDPRRARAGRSSRSSARGRPCSWRTSRARR